MAKSGWGGSSDESAQEPRQRSSLRALFTNWRESDPPIDRKLGAVVRNNWIKLWTRRNCCGHPGEPGC